MMYFSNTYHNIRMESETRDFGLNITETGLNYKTQSRDYLSEIDDLPYGVRQEDECKIMDLLSHTKDGCDIISPLDQFEIRDLLSIHAPLLGNLSVSFTNIALYLTTGGYIIFVISLLSTNDNKLVPNR